MEEKKKKKTMDGMAIPELAKDKIEEVAGVKIFERE